MIRIAEHKILKQVLVLNGQRQKQTRQTKEKLERMEQTSILDLKDNLWNTPKDGDWESKKMFENL